MPDPQPFEYKATGGLEQIRAHIERMFKNSEDQGTLVIEVVGGVGEQFVQFTGGRVGLQMSFPLVTPAQRARERVIRNFMEAQGHKITTTAGSDGSNFLDIDLPPDASHVTDLTEKVFADVFRLESDIQLSFTGENLGVAA